MSIASDADVMMYARSCGLPVPDRLAPLVRIARTSAERLLRDYIGYDVQYDAARVAYLPHGQANPRSDGDWTSVGFDLVGAQIVQREIGRTTRREIVLPSLPVKSITSVYDNPASWNTAGGDWPASSLLNQGSYYLDVQDDEALSWTGILYRNVGSWSHMPRTIKIVYAAGLTAAELDNDYPNFKMAVLTAAAAALGKVIARGRVALTGAMVTSVSIEDFSTSFGVNPQTSFDGAGLSGVEFPTEARGYVQRYRHVAGLV